jgi:hypothetical protein
MLASTEQVSTPAIEQAAKYVEHEAKMLKAFASATRPDLLVEVRVHMLSHTQQI